MSTRIAELLSNIRQIEGAVVDKNYLQGEDALKEQYDIFGIEADYLQLRKLMAYHQETVLAIREWIRPYTLPDEYLFFLAYCGGLCVRQVEFANELFGVGPLNEKYYAYIQGYVRLTEPAIDRFLHIGQIHISHEGEETFYEEIFLDLAGVIKEGCVIGVSERDKSRSNLSYAEILNDKSHSTMWKHRWNDFYDYLQYFLITKGSLAVA